MTAALHLAADALALEASADKRLAEEYDAAQKRGEVESPGGDRKTIIPNGKNDKAKVNQVGLTAKQVHEARQVRDLEARDPGVVERTAKAIEDAGRGPLVGATPARWSVAVSKHWLRTFFPAGSVSIRPRRSSARRCVRS